MKQRTGERKKMRASCEVYNYFVKVAPIKAYGIVCVCNLTDLRENASLFQPPSGNIFRFAAELTDKSTTYLPNEAGTFASAFRKPPTYLPNEAGTFASAFRKSPSDVPS